MARRCELTGKKSGYGNQRSHSNRATKRRFFPNLVKKRILDPKTGLYRRMTISTAALRTLSKENRMAEKRAKELMRQE